LSRLVHSLLILFSAFWALFFLRSYIDDYFLYETVELVTQRKGWLDSMIVYGIEIT